MTDNEIILKLYSKDYGDITNSIREYCEQSCTDDNACGDCIFTYCCPFVNNWNFIDKDGVEKLQEKYRVRARNIKLKKVLNG